MSLLRLQGGGDKERDYSVSYIIKGFTMGSNPIPSAIHHFTRRYNALPSTRRLVVSFFLQTNRILL